MSDATRHEPPLRRLFSRALIGRVLIDFRANQGLLLAGAVAFYTLLSIVPLFAVLVVALSHLVDQERLVAVLVEQLELLVAGSAVTLEQDLRALIDNREVVGGLGAVVLLFFGSLAFTVLERAMSIIFYHRVRTHRRRAVVTLAIPYLFVSLLGLGLLTVSLISATLNALARADLFLHAVGIVGQIAILTALYLVMPVGRVSFRHALIGGVAAGLMWEVTRRVLVWYFSTLSFVNLVYGSIAATIVALLSFEAGATIVLLGAQVVAELERGDEPPGVPWETEVP